MATSRALFQVNDVLVRQDDDGNTTSQIVKLNPSYETGVNKEFFQATPTGSLEMTINNPGAFDFFKRGKKYWLDFTPAE